MDIKNKPEFFVVKLERIKQLLNKLKEAISIQIRSTFVEKEWLPVFEEKMLQELLRLYSFKDFSLAEKIVYFLSKTSEVEPPPLEISVDKLKSAIARYEYYLTFPLILSEDKESLVSPQRGVGGRVIYWRGRRGHKILCRS